ncbi:hypothetical protein Kpho01_75790 [Kitasatospora phosalacinea]|uniref:Uncharacterized protein n=1 Tax=Kitasatospora phosalacinea TaxID=2065 RepID=A0A9W6PRB9_9ACTN|nr:hypothetical protein Kpho01_75790 [Kitasatospora phosalacinea]
MIRRSTSRTSNGRDIASTAALTASIACNDGSHRGLSMRPRYRRDHGSHLGRET